jgi:cytochrome c nitrite reductase small subunit
MSPRLSLLIGLAALVIALGMFTYTSGALTYMGTAPSTCGNCHVMDSQYENWFHAPHERFAECTDCHLPHGNVLAYYFEKGRSGMHDVFIFSTGQAPAIIRASKDSKAIVQENCLRCHEETVQDIVMGAQPFERYCWECHRSVAHGERGASGAPYQDSVIYPAK